MSLSVIIAEVVSAITDLIPRVTARPASNQWLVLDSWYSKPRICYFPALYVPVLTHAEYYPKAGVFINPDVQTLTTADGVTCVVNTGAVVSVDDPILLRNYFAEEDWEEGISLIIRSRVAQHHCERMWDECTEQEDKLEAELVETLFRYGIALVSFAVEDRAIVRSYRHFGWAGTE